MHYLNVPLLHRFCFIQNRKIHKQGTNCVELLISIGSKWLNMRREMFGFKIVMLSSVWRHSLQHIQSDFFFHCRSRKDYLGSQKLQWRRCIGNSPDYISDRLQDVYVTHITSFCGRSCKTGFSYFTLERRSYCLRMFLTSKILTHFMYAYIRV